LLPHPQVKLRFAAVEFSVAAAQRYQLLRELEEKGCLEEARDSLRSQLTVANQELDSVRKARNDELQRERKVAEERGRERAAHAAAGDLNLAESRHRDDVKSLQAQINKRTSEQRQTARECESVKSQLERSRAEVSELKRDLDEARANAPRARKLARAEEERDAAVAGRRAAEQRAADSAAAAKEARSDAAAEAKRADAAEADAETLRTQLLEVSAVASTARAESESLRAAAAAAAVPPEPGSIRAHLLTLANRRGPYAGAADDTSRSDRRHRSQERELLSCVLAELCTSLTYDDLASALFSAKLLDGLFYESLEGRAFKTKVIAAYAGAHAARWTIEEALAFMIDNNLSLGKMQRVRESFSLAYDTERRRFVHGRLAAVEGDEWLFDGMPEKFVMVLDPVPSRTALVKAWAAFRHKLPIPTNDDGSVATLPFIATVSTLIEENIRLKMLDEGVGSIEKPGYINVASDAFPVENTSITHTAVGVVTRDDISNQSPTQLAPIQAGRYKETNVQYHRQWGDSGLRADINETLRLGYIPLSNGDKFYCTLMFCLDKKGAEVFLGKGQCNPYSLNSWAERLEVPWDPDDPPADINAMMKLLIGEHGILTNFPLSHNMLRTIAHVPLEGEELPRPCALCDPDAPPCKPYATVAEREERVAAVQRMRDDTSEVGKKQYAAARSAYRGKHGDVNEHEFPIVNVGTDRFPPEYLHYYLINAPKQMTKNTCLRHLSAHTLERVTAFLTGMGYKLDVSKGGKISGWFKGADWQTMLLGGEQCPGGAPAWWSQLVWCIGEWELEHRNRAAPDPPPWHTNQSRVPADLESAMKARYGAELAKNLLQMLEGHDALLALTKIACEPTPDQAAMDDVAYRHGLAGATQLWTFAPRPFVTPPPPPPRSVHMHGRLQGVRG